MISEIDLPRLLFSLHQRCLAPLVHFAPQGSGTTVVNLSSQASITKVLRAFVL